MPPAFGDGHTLGAYRFDGEVRPIREVQRAYVRWALERFEGNKGRTAENLGIDAKTLWRWLNDEPSEGA